MNQTIIIQPVKMSYHHSVHTLTQSFSKNHQNKRNLVILFTKAIFLAAYERKS